MQQRRLLLRILYGGVLCLAFLATLGMGILLQSKTYFYKESVAEQVTPPETIIPFPVGVNVTTETITENPVVETYLIDTLAVAPERKSNWQTLIAKLFSNKGWYQSLASPVSRILVIWPGERHEEIVEHIGDILRWNTEERIEFTNLVQASEPILTEGKFLPGQYTVHIGTTPEEVATMIQGRFIEAVTSRYTPEVEASVPFVDALIIASLLEREASDFENMREISGVIWNRLFINMPLQLDATLQYARGSRSYEPKWWPVPIPKDKYIDSPFNTYQNKGLPPAPIANPSPEAILAALNPRLTECLYYFHDTNQDFYCSDTYEAHVAKLKQLYGRGK